jgi:hypothetical protein
MSELCIQPGDLVEHLLCIMDLFNNPVGCFTSLADLADFCKKSAKSAVFQRKLFNNCSY